MQTRAVRPSNTRWQLLGLIIAAGFIAYVLRSNMSVAGEAMMRDLQLSKTQLGFVLAAFAWGYAAFQFVGGALGDKYGGRRVLTWCAVAWGVLNLMIGLMPSSGMLSITVTIGALVVLRALMGVAQAPLFPVTCGGMLCAWFPVSRWALAAGISNVGVTLGAAAASPLIAWLVQLYGWRASYVITAPLGVALGIVWWRFVRDTPSEHRRVTASELSLINYNRPAFASGAAPSGAWKRVLRDPQVVLLSLSYFASNYLYYFFFNWLFIYLVENRGMKLLEGGFYAAAPWIAGTVGALIGGYGGDKLSALYGKRWGFRSVGLAGMVLAALFISLVTGASTPMMAVVLLSLCLGSQQISESVFWAATIAVSGRDASTATGLLNTGGNVAGGVGALMVPLLVERFGWSGALTSAALFSLFGAALWFFIDAARDTGNASTVAA